MKAEKLKLSVDILIGNCVHRAPGECSALCRGEVFDRVEGECREIGDGAHGSSLVGCAESVGGIRKDRHSAYCLLKRV